MIYLLFALGALFLFSAAVGKVVSVQRAALVPLRSKSQRIVYALLGVIIAGFAVHLLKGGAAS